MGLRAGAEEAGAGIITVHLAESGVLSEFQAYQKTGHRATALPGELGQAAVEE